MLLARDVEIHTDGGGKGPAFPQPIHGRERVTRLVSGYAPEHLGAVRYRSAEINGQPGRVFFDAQGRAVLVIALDIAGDRVVAMRNITNPDKLRHLDQVPAGEEAR